MSHLTGQFLIVFHELLVVLVDPKNFTNPVSSGLRLSETAWYFWSFSLGKLLTRQHNAVSCVFKVIEKVNVALSLCEMTSGQKAVPARLQQKHGRSRTRRSWWLSRQAWGCWLCLKKREKKEIHSKCNSTNKHRANNEIQACDLVVRVKRRHVLRFAELSVCFILDACLRKNPD